MSDSRCGYPVGAVGPACYLGVGHAGECRALDPRPADPAVELADARREILALWPEAGGEHPDWRPLYLMIRSLRRG